MHNLYLCFHMSLGPGVWGQKLLTYRSPLVTGSLKTSVVDQVREALLEFMSCL